MLSRASKAITCKTGHLVSIAWTVRDQSREPTMNQSVVVECPICGHDFTALIDGRADPSTVKVEAMRL